MKLQDQIFRKFKVTFVGFKRLKSQDTENARFSVLINVNIEDQYCSPKNVTKAMLHIKHYNVTIENIT